MSWPVIVPRELAGDVTIRKYLREVGYRDPIIRHFHAEFGRIGRELTLYRDELESARRRRDSAGIMWSSRALRTAEDDMSLAYEEYVAYLQTIPTRIWQHYLATRFYCGSEKTQHHMIDVYVLTYSEEKEDIELELFGRANQYARHFCRYALFWDEDIQPEDYGYAIQEVSIADLPSIYPRYPNMEVGRL